MPGWFDRLFGLSAKAPPRPVVVPAPEQRGTPGPAGHGAPSHGPGAAPTAGANHAAPAHAAAHHAPPPPRVLVESAETGLELAEIKPIGVVVPKNKQELMEELRKNYTEVIELVRKVNVHLDEQGGRLAAQEARSEQLMRLATQVPEVLTRMHEQNARFIQLMEGVHEDLRRFGTMSERAQAELRDAVGLQTRASAEHADRLSGSIAEVERGVREGLSRAQEAQEGVARSLGEVGASTGTLVTLVQSTQAELARQQQTAARQQQEMLHRLDQNRWYAIVAAICGLLLMGAAAFVAMRFMQ